MEERRRFIRVSLVAKVTNMATKEHHFFHSRDISQGGIFLETKEPYPVGTEVELDFFLSFPDRKERIVVRGRVVRVQPFDMHTMEEKTPGMGVAFLNLSEADLSRMESFVREILYESLS